MNKKFEVHYNLLTFKKLPDAKEETVVKAEGKKFVRVLKAGTDAIALIAKEEGVPVKCIAVTSSSVADTQ